MRTFKIVCLSFIPNYTPLTLCLEYPHIQISDRNPVVNVGNKEHPMYLPAEVCVVLPGQPIGRRLSPLQTQEMITFACRKPWENANSIVGDGRAVLGLNPAANSISVGVPVNDV
jgi:hypothetical protein